MILYDPDFAHSVCLGIILAKAGPRSPAFVPLYVTNNIYQFRSRS